MFPSHHQNIAQHGDPVQFREVIRGYGKLGYHLWKMGNHRDWSGYFRCGDTPSVSYLLDPYDDEDPTQLGWAGRFVRPFPNRPNYYTGISGGYDWDYATPTKTWHNAEKVFIARIRTLLDTRLELYRDYQERLERLYGEPIR